MFRSPLTACAIVILASLACTPARALTEAQQDAAIASLQSTVTAQQATINTLVAKLKYVSTTGTDMTISGANLHVVSGAGHTNSAPNGLGNVVIGYDDARSGTGAVNTRTGSHNLILGMGNNYSAYGSIVAGFNNTASGSFSSVNGGYGNTASANYCVVSGGYNNTASASCAAVGGGANFAASTANTFLPTTASTASLQSFQNQITSLQSTTAAQGKVTNLFSLSTDATRSDGKPSTELTLTGVNLHVVNGLGATNGEPGNPTDTSSAIVNGLGNLIIGYNELSPGSAVNTRTGSHNLIIGMENNYSSFGGMNVGISNVISAPFASVSGGTGNTASAIYSSVSGGLANVSNGYASSISGGDFNTATGNFSSISGGISNTATYYATSVSGGDTVTAGTYAQWTGGAYHTP